MSSTLRRPKSYQARLLIKRLYYDFLAFTFVGWVWEEVLTLVTEHMLANRGTLHALGYQYMVMMV